LYASIDPTSKAHKIDKKHLIKRWLIKWYNNRFSGHAEIKRAHEHVAIS
jgi:hypothetical protein